MTFVGVAALAAFAANDPVIMTINGKDVKLSEFQYLYSKNNQQQLQQESLDDYVDRYVIYKLKVAAAEDAGIDTLPRVQMDLAKYKDELLEPFLIDTVVRNKLIADSYQRMCENVDIDHIMLPLGEDANTTKVQLDRLDSIRSCVLAGESFAALADRFSIDPSVKNNHGHYGFVTSGVFPYEFENKVFETPVGQMCAPFRTDFGVHLIRVNARRPDPGTVQVEHILKLFAPRDGKQRTPEELAQLKAQAKLQIDSIYALILSGQNFEKLARELSDDKASAKNGGSVGWFGVGKMVKPFEETAFRLQPGDISEPFETHFGYHIMKKINAKPVAEFNDELKQQLLRGMMGDERRDMPFRARMAEVKKKYNYKKNTKFEDYLKKQLKSHGGYDSTFVADVIGKSKETIFTFAGIKEPASSLTPYLNPKAKILPEYVPSYIMGYVDELADEKIYKHYQKELLESSSEYSHILNEYRDGTLLFEISNRKVWDAAGRDKEGLKAYFEEHRGDYTWDAPRFKGIILMSKNDSVENAVKADLGPMLAQSLPIDTITTRIHAKYKSDVKMERYLAKKGDNAVIDWLIFNGPKAEINPKYSTVFVLDRKIITAPETYEDVKGQITSDYQEVLEERWVKELKQKYPVVINRDVLKKVKP